MKLILTFFSLLLTSSLALGKPVKILTTTTDIAWAAQEIGGPFVKVEAMLKGTEDPHYISASPLYVFKSSSADIVCSIGLDLESGWLPRVLRRSGNTQVQSGSKGHCELGSQITALGIPSGKVDRSHGHVHAKGNPHFWLSPRVFAQGAKSISEAIIRIRPELKNEIATRYNNFATRMNDLETTMRKIVGTKKINVMEYHAEFEYFFSALGLKSWGALEEKPGLPPSAARIALVALQAKKANVAAILATPATRPDTLKQFSAKSGVRVIQHPVSVGANFNSESYQNMLLELTKELVGSMDVSVQKNKI